MRMLAEFFPEFAEMLDKMDELYNEKRTIDEKTYQFICFALSIKARSKPCVLKHLKGALILKKICGVLVILGGMYLLWSA